MANVNTQWVSSPLLVTKVFHSWKITLFLFITISLEFWHGVQQTLNSKSEWRLVILICVCMSAQSCLTLHDLLEWSLPGFSVHGILKARTLEWVAILFSRRSSQPRDWTCVSGLLRWQVDYLHCTTWDLQEGKLVVQMVKNLPAVQETWVQSLGLEDPLEKGMATHTCPFFHGQKSLVGYSPWITAGDLGSIPGLGRSPGEGNSYPHLSILSRTEEPGGLQSMDR